MNSIKNLVRQTVQEAVSTTKLSKVKRSFNLDEFKTLNATKAITLHVVRVNYLNTHGQYLGEGIARKVWGIDNTKVLKLSEQISTLQNQREVVASTCAEEKGTSKIITRVLEHAEDFSWIISERAGSLFMDERSVVIAQNRVLEFPKEIEFNSDHNITQLVEFYFHPHFAKQPVFDQRLAWLKEHRNTWWKTLLKLMQGCNIDSDDLHFGNWGIKDRKLVLVDYGF